MTVIVIQFLCLIYCFLVTKELTLSDGHSLVECGLGYYDMSSNFHYLLSDIDPSIVFDKLQPVVKEHLSTLTAYDNGAACEFLFYLLIMNNGIHLTAAVN